MTSIEKALVDRYPTNEIPRGGLSEIAREFGVSRQYVFDVAKRVGVRIVAKSWTCAYCHASLRVALSSGRSPDALHFCNYECLGRAKGRNYEFRTVGEHR